MTPVLLTAGSGARAVFQVRNATTASAWTVAKTTTSTVPVAPNSLFKKDVATGACSSASHAGGFIVPLTPAPAPVVAALGGVQVTR